MLDMESASPWLLRMPHDLEQSCAGYPTSLREVVLLASAQSTQIQEALQSGNGSLADPSSLHRMFRVCGLDEDKRVRINNNEDLRSFFSAARDPKMLFVGPYKDAEQEDGSPSSLTMSTSEYVAAREYSKRQESVKLNVGGHIREVHQATAERIPLLAAMMRFPRDGDTPIFIDASPQVFDVLLEIARGRSTKYVEALEPSLKLLVQDYAEYAGMLMLRQECFHFSMTTKHPGNSSCVNSMAYLSQEGSVYTTGVRPQWNTVFGDTSIPQVGQSYWEVEVMQLAPQSKDFVIGVVSQAFSSMHNTLDAGNAGWGIMYCDNGNVFQRMNGNNQGIAFTDAFNIREGTRIGIMLDADRGSLMFFHHGVFKMSHMSTLKGQVLFPAFSILGETKLKLISGLLVPS